MRAASAWHVAQVLTTFSGFTFERWSFAARMVCGVWQSLQTATFSSPCARFFPWTLVWYCASWSVRSDGLYFRMYSPFEWQLAQSAGMSARFGLPLKPFALLIAVSSAALGSPPWHAEQSMPLLAWMSCAAISGVTCSGPSSTEWQSMQLLCGACPCAGVASSKAAKNSPTASATTLHEREGFGLFCVIRIKGHADDVTDSQR